jgi:hypothetical protein
MGMTGNFMAIPAGTLHALISDPAAILNVLYPDEQQARESSHLNVDKAWHGIHYLLTGEAWGGEFPLAAAVLGGQEIGENFGYGPTRYLVPEEVKTVAAALDRLPAGELAKRYSPGKLQTAQIYPDGIWITEGEEALGYLLNYYGELVKFYGNAAGCGRAVLQYIM